MNAEHGADPSDGNRGIGAPRLFKMLRSRIVAVGAITTALSIGGFSLVLTWLALDATETRLSDLLLSDLRVPLEATCSQDPATFGFAGERGTWVYAYDGDTGRSANASAPALLPDAQASVIGPTVPVGTSSSAATIGTGAYVATRMLAHGPCAVMVISWETDPAVPRSLRLLVLAVFFSILFIAGATSIAFVLRPLLQRIGRLSDVASHVGDSSYRPGAGGIDELGQIESALDVAHARIVADASELERRHNALAEHLEHIAHDLRTPIASLQLKLERLSSSWNDEKSHLDQERSEIVDEAMEDAVYVGALADNLRVAARLQDGLDPKAALAPNGPLPQVDLGDVVERVATRMRVLAHRKGVTLEWARPDASVVVRCQSTMAHQLVQNLVQNAVAYQDRDGNVAVVLEQHQDRFVLNVVDDGPGVPPEDLPRLVGRTFRTDDARARDVAGSGLGLSIAGEIASRADFALSFSANVPRGLLVKIEGPTLDENEAE